MNNSGASALFKKCANTKKNTTRLQKLPLTKYEFQHEFNFIIEAAQ